MKLHYMGGPRAGETREFTVPPGQSKPPAVLTVHAEAAAKGMRGMYSFASGIKFQGLPVMQWQEFAKGSIATVTIDKSGAKLKESTA